MSKKDTARDPESGKAGASNLTKPEKSNAPIGMPNVSPAIQKEIERLTKELLNDMKSLIVMNVDYGSIDFIPEQDIEIDNQVDFISNEWISIQSQINEKLKLGDPTSSSYPDFLDMFEIRYNVINGEQTVVFNLEFSGFGVDDLSLEFADVKSGAATVGRIVS